MLKPGYTVGVNTRSLGFALLAALGWVGCDGATASIDAGASPPADAGAPPPSGSDAGPGSDAGTTSVDAGISPVTDAGAIDAAAPSGTGSLTGNVTRSAAPAAGGRGHLYVAVFTSDPVTDRTGAMNVANARVENVDMSADGASIPYTVSGIPPRAEPYFVTAFLDDNGTVSATDPSAAGPDRGDLVALEGFASPRVTVSSEAPVALDLVLNFNLPF